MTEFHPIQTHDVTRRGTAVMPSEVALLAYEVYCHVFGPQPAMVDLIVTAPEGRALLRKGADEIDRLQVSERMAKYWREQYDVTRAHLERVRAALSNGDKA